MQLVLVPAVRVEQEEELGGVELREEGEVAEGGVAMVEGVDVGLVGWWWCGGLRWRVDDGA